MNDNTDREPTREESLDASVKDGVCTALTQGTGDSYVSAFAIFLEGTPTQIGAIAAIPQFIGAIFQLVSLKLLDHIRSRRRLLKLGALTQGLSWFPIAFLPFVFGRNETAAWVLLVCITLGFAAGGILGPIWNSLIGDIVPAEERGRFFGYRNQQASIASMVALMMGGGTLHVAKQYGYTEYAFFLLFSVAFIARVSSAYFLGRHMDPPAIGAPEDRFTFWQFIRRVRESNFVKFVLFVSLFNASIWIAAPFFSIYMLRDVKFSYLEFTVLSAFSIAAQVLTMQHWGRLSDKFGNKRILNVAAAGVTMGPFLWLISSNFWYLLLVQSVIGFFFAGFTLAAANFLFDAVSPSKRARCVAYQGIINGTCVFLGSFAGGKILTNVPHSLIESVGLWTPPSAVLTVILASGLARIVMLCLVMPLFREVRKVEEIDHVTLLVRIAYIRPLTGVGFSLFTSDRVTGDKGERRGNRELE